ncbi:hypothetical protein Anapl_06620 [Anas platyrhynchos]|uniref:Uncharacterized protein n=1 Tax=Anas platyrhynchos TaxID=8839 RepID=R0KC38_ANAPL|nr:hypothetical protein Anapl_06620 [Anas platyrhynchos]
MWKWLKNLYGYFESSTELYKCLLQNAQERFTDIYGVANSVEEAVKKSELVLQRANIHKVRTGDAPLLIRAYAWHQWRTPRAIEKEALTSRSSYIPTPPSNSSHWRQLQNVPVPLEPHVISPASQRAEHDQYQPRRPEEEWAHSISTPLRPHLHLWTKVLISCNNAVSCSTDCKNNSNITFTSFPNALFIPLSGEWCRRLQETTMLTIQLQKKSARMREFSIALSESLNNILSLLDFMRLKPQILHYTKNKKTAKGTAWSMCQKACLSRKNTSQCDFISLKIRQYGERTHKSMC